MTDISCGVVQAFFCSEATVTCVVPEAMHKASRGPLKGAISAQKSLQGSRTETRELLGGTKEHSVEGCCVFEECRFALQANR